MRGLLALMMLVLGSEAIAAPPAKWQAEVPLHVREPGIWTDLVGEMLEAGMYHGSMAAAVRLLVFFTSIDAKEAGYRIIIELVDAGYPFSTLPKFLTGDLSPSVDFDFVNNYNLYKYILNKELRLDKWATHYLEGIDKEKFTKYQLFMAIEEYSKGNLKVAEEKLHEILGKDFGENQHSFVRKAIRTLARVYFDEKEYEKAFDIYSNFLLKLRPVNPSDWLEAAWSLYYLKRYPEAIGYLYNLESQAASSFLNLEKYTIRALSYRNLCQTGHAEALLDSFKGDYGQIVNALKRGENVSQFPQLAELEVPGNEMFRRVSLTLIALRREMDSIPALPKKLQPVAKYLYQTEVAMLMQTRKAYADDAMERSATRLLLTEEHLRFLSFDVQRESVNPDRVFAPKEEDEISSPYEDINGSELRIRWPQLGEYWIDERLNYVAHLSNACPD
jgi:tetratricopeptide (TPR) repeat protein